MPPPGTAEPVMEHGWYAIIDCAQDPRLIGMVERSPARLCLFKGRSLSRAVLETAPWLVRLDPGSELLNAWQREGRGKSWGIMVYSALDLPALQRFFRRYLQAKLPDGTIALFRFYDPRVFITYLGGATPEERAPWFDGVDQYSVEAAGGTASHHFRLWEGRLFDGDRLVGG